MSTTKTTCESEAGRMRCSLGPLSCSDGSAEFTHGDTTTLASVNGPMEIKMSKENIEKATVEMLYKQKSGLPSCAERAIESYLKSVCESVVLTDQHPRSSVTVVVQEIHDAGGLLATALNAMTMAVLDAALPTNGLVAAAHCILDNDDVIVAQPTREQENEAKASFTVVFDSRNWEIVTSHCHGQFTKEQYVEALNKCRETAKSVQCFMKEAMAKKYSKYK